MKYIGKVWLKPVRTLPGVVAVLGLRNIKIFGEDLVGTKGKDIILLHVSWGTIDKVSKLRMYVHSHKIADITPQYQKLLKKLEK